MEKDRLIWIFLKAPDFMKFSLSEGSLLMAAENALGIKVTQRTEFLRGLLLHGEAIESHALHLGCLVLPDLLGYDGPLAMAKDFPGQVSIAPNLKKLENQVQDLIGGRAIHPINAVVGGFGRIPKRKN
jgi:sulfhydrogenase subunit alpha